MKLKILGLATIAVLLSGCDTPKRCINKGYTGVVISKIDSSPDIHCSNGDSTPNKSAWITSAGDKIKSNYLYAEFLKEPTKMKL